MITRDKILLYLYRDGWFEPSDSENKAEIQDENGNTIFVSKSYYHHYDDLGDLVIRVSEHGTYLQTWVEHEPNVAMNLQNLSVVFSNGPIEYSKKTLPKLVKDENGNIKTMYVYFVVEQYVYRLDNLALNDFFKVINQVKSLSADKVFSDPLKKKPNKKANRTVLEPDDEDGRPISQYTNPIHARQKIVADNPHNEVDATGKVIKEYKRYNTMNNTRNKVRLTESQLQRVIEESLKKVINESDFHRAFKSGKSLDVLHSPDGTYQDSDIWECLAELKEKLRQAEERAKMPHYGDEGKTRNYLVGAIRGLQAFIDSRY